MTATTTHEAFYIRFRPLSEGETVARTVDYNDKGQVMIDLDANNEIIGVEILSYKEVEVDGLCIYNMKSLASLFTMGKGVSKNPPVTEQSTLTEEDYRHLDGTDCQRG